MTGIYSDDFVKFLESHLGHVKVKTKNIITKCPWCEMDKDKAHYHMYISTQSPIFHCFHASCKISGTIPKLLRKINGIDDSEKYIDREAMESFKDKKLEIKTSESKIRDIDLLELGESQFRNKYMYVKQRLKFSNINYHKLGLVFDIIAFITKNKIVLETRYARMLDYIQSNFVGFITQNNSVLICRNIDPTSNFKHLKIKIQETDYLDYYKRPGYNRYSNNVIVAEGVFDILHESIFDVLGLKKDVAFYASALSANYTSLIKSFAYYENLYKMNVYILSDRGIDKVEYKKTKYYDRHLVDSMTVYYNRTGKDFATTPVNPERFVI